MDVKELPLVSCIMPTYNRRGFVPHAIRYFLRQDYENKELIIIDDGEDSIRDIVPDYECIHYYRLEKKITLGAKLNLGCSYSKGTIIANWDDDDWYAERRLQYQVDALHRERTEVCGINNLLYYDLRNKSSYRYVYPKDQRVWLLGSSLCYTRKSWERNQFADINVGMDGLFVWRNSPDRVTVLPDSTIAVHTIHENNVSPKNTNGSWWHAYPVEDLKHIMQNDWNLYNNGVSIPEKKPISVKETFQPPVIAVKPKPLRNIYACLVHENEDCIIDLVRNLHYHDPASTIVLYNGGGNSNLIQPHFPYDKFGAVVYPNPVPVKHGYLHSFALNCMQFSLENFSFDCLTIVDSDQLAIRSGYSQYLAEFLTSRDSIGMLSSNPDRVLQNDRTNQTAIQAYKEYDLWKPLLNSFPNGEEKFVHWTFWPSSAFTADVAKDLVMMFEKNDLLKTIMKQTRIWATEEVILPTLVSLLGYEIAANPCSYDFVKYRKSHTLQDINCAFGKADAFWAHPIERRYDNPLRKRIREKFHHYALTNTNEHENNSMQLFSTLSLINRIRKIEGWMDDMEADLLISLTVKSCKELPPPNNIVEIGSYHGKSTVLFGSVVNALCPGARVYSIDSHDGKLGAADQGLRSFPPSYSMLKRNIESAGLAGVVEIIKDKSYNVKWDAPVTFLFIDGLHDYPNVARDFWHFSEWIIPGGYVAFHDYADYFPGVQAFVHELLETKTYVKIQRVNSLIILQKSDSRKETTSSQNLN